MIYVKIHVNSMDRILAACDEEVLGTTLSEGKMRFHVSDGFYNGELVSEETFIDRTKSVAIMNLVGNRTVELAIREGLVDPGAVITIQGVKHAQTVVM